MQSNNKLNNTYLTGIAMVMVYVLISGFQSVYLVGFLKKADVYVTLTINFSFVTLFFLIIKIIKYKSIPQTINIIKSNYFHVILLNFTHLFHRT